MYTYILYTTEHSLTAGSACNKLSSLHTPSYLLYVDTPYVGIYIIYNILSLLTWELQVSPTHDFSTDIPRSLSNHIYLLYLFEFFFTPYMNCAAVDLAPFRDFDPCRSMCVRAQSGPRALSTLVVAVSQRLHV